MTDLSSWTAYFQDFGQFFNGFLFTLALAIGSFILAMVLGIFFGAMSTSKRPILRILARIFVEFYQNTPLLVQFVIVFYGLPLISDHIIMIPIYWTAVLCVGLYHGAYIAEVIRSGIQSIPSGQMEAARILHIHNPNGCRFLEVSRNQCDSVLLLFDKHLI